ncbi:C69 family dipeptidase [Ferruginivarius sediminum]|uniref:Dipeptidase n=1 Tax=Ferruginivarius sediminum TaxID=2661937 RepID=A0A369TB23_9PROT|nr:C69 family dipeptidase [Ferruginivarius sediminum]RDD62478.1 peptidase U34 [Ferruginivarius sediminum]
MPASRAYCVAITVALMCVPAISEASYGLYVGRNLTSDGSVFIGGTGDEVSSHYLRIVPHQTHPEGARITVGLTEEAEMYGGPNKPGKLTEIPQVRETYKYISMTYTNWAGFPPPLTNGGLNEQGVAARDIWSPSRTELIEMTEAPQTGPQYSDLSRIVMQRASSAREAVEIVGEMIDKYGYSTYGGNSHMFADAEEGWVLIDFAGSQGLWVAERLGPNEVRMSYPGYIGDIPKDYQDDPDYMGSDNLISFAVEQGWYDPDSGEPFNVHKVYGAQDAPMRRPTVNEIEHKLETLTPGISFRQFMNVVRDPAMSKDSNGYGQAVRLNADTPHKELRTLWVAPTGSVTAPFIPWRIGVTSVPPEFRKHRYLTKGSASTFVTAEAALQEASQFAGRLFKRLMYYTCHKPDKFLPEVTEALVAFEDTMLKDGEAVEQTALTLYQNGQDELARKYLTGYSHDRAYDALELGEDLVGSIEARTRLLYDIPVVEAEPMGKLDYEMVTCR